MSEEQKNEQSNEEAKESKNKKINKMTLQELEDALKKTKESQGGLYSRYAKELLKRKEVLSNK